MLSSGIKKIKARIATKAASVGGSLCNDWCQTTLAEIILSVVDPYVGDAHDPGNQPMTDIVYMHRANHRIQLSSLKDIYGVRYMLDVSKQQLRVHL